MIQRYWNKRILSAPIGLLILFRVIITSIIEKLNSNLLLLNIGSYKENCNIQLGCKIRYPGNIHLGKEVQISRNCIFESHYPTSKLHIGDNSQITYNCVLDFTGELQIGNNVVISDHVDIQTHTHGMNPRNIAVGSKLFIEDNVWIGSHCIILSSVNTIGHNSIIGAGTILTKDVPPNSVVVGIAGSILRQNKIKE